MPSAGRSQCLGRSVTGWMVGLLDGLEELVAEAIKKQQRLDKLETEHVKQQAILTKSWRNMKTMIPKVSWFLPIFAFLSDQLAKVLLQEGQWNTATAMWTWSTWYYNGLLKSWRPAPAASVASCQESPRIVSSRRSCPHLPTVISEILPTITDPLTLHLEKQPGAGCPWRQGWFYGKRLRDDQVPGG